MTTRHHSFDAIQADEDRPGLPGISAEQLMTLYRAAVAKEAPIILELGAERGASATMFLQACSERGGHVVSVDIEDCSDISDSDQWTFVRSDSTAVGHILSAAPVLLDGVDVLYIDSLHRLDHVEEELTGWYPHLNEGCVIFFDDIDAAPYRKGQRKDSVTNERNWALIFQYVQAFFYGNSDTTRLDAAYGSTGLARLRKFSPRGTVPNPPDWSAVKPRVDVLDVRYTVARLRKRLGRWG